MIEEEEEEVLFLVLRLAVAPPRPPSPKSTSMTKRWYITVIYCANPSPSFGSRRKESSVSRDKRSFLGRRQKRKCPHTPASSRKNIASAAPLSTF
jgi:hypothetical protein